MLRPGDWIQVPSRNINGVVLEVGLMTIKVQNFDMTIITVPPYSLLSESFQNWRGMTDSGGRRVERSVVIDVNTVRLCTPEELEAYRREPWAEAIGEGEEHVNLTVFRRYLSHFIALQKSLNKEMTYMVRELAPTSQGVPVQVYLFTTRQEWVAYEEFQATLLDRILAAVNRFGLKVYQAPSGEDVRMISR